MEKAKKILDEYIEKYLTTDFISEDPIFIPHQFSAPRDIEISGFFTALISWGKRSLIIKSATRLMNLMEWNPYKFLMETPYEDLQVLEKFYHRTFQPFDTVFLAGKLKEIYASGSSLKQIFYEGFKKDKIKGGIYALRSRILGNQESIRTKKHLPNPYAGASAKRLNMFLRWMVRKDFVDFGIWQDLISPSELMIPLDVHVGRSARELGLLSRKSDDWKAVEELTEILRRWNSKDPVFYDFGLFFYSHSRRGKI